MKKTIKTSIGLALILTLTHSAWSGNTTPQEPQYNTKTKKTNITKAKPLRIRLLNQTHLKKSPIVSFAKNPNKKSTSIILGCKNGYVLEFDYCSYKTKILLETKNKVNCIDLHPINKSLFAIGLNNGKTIVYDNTKKSYLTLENRIKNPILSLKWNPKDENELFTVDSYNLLAAWNINKKSFNFIITDEVPYSLDISSQSNTMALGSIYGKIYIYDRQKKMITNEWQAHEGEINFLKWHPTKNNILSSSSPVDKYTYLWDLKKNKTTKKIKGAYPPVAFDRKEKPLNLMLCTDKRDICMFNTETNTLHPFSQKKQTQDAPITYEIIWKQDENRILTLSNDGTLAVYKLLEPDYVIPFIENEKRFADISFNFKQKS